MFEPDPDLPDETLLSDVQIPTRIRNALLRAGICTAGEVRAVPDTELLRRRYIAKYSVEYLRRTLGASSLISGRGQVDSDRGSPTARKTITSRPSRG